MAPFVGTSGWAYKEWKGGFYPPDLPLTRFLQHYSQALGACEINATFYRLQSPQTFARWVGATREDFRFAVKAHRRLTHGKFVAPDPARRSFQETFFESLATLGGRLACVLLQFPPYRERDDDGFEQLLGSLPGGLRFAFEFRHESWQSPEVSERIAAAGGTVCFADTSGPPPAALPPGPIAYVRLRSPRYSEAERSAWLVLLRHEAKRRDVYAFAKHEGVPAGDPYTGVGFAQWLAENLSRGTCS
jgi:uncharacterized protein YecE (DUF72 family)